jgi:hypothetical protein
MNQKMKFFPAHKGSKVIPVGVALRDPLFCQMLLGIILLRNGGETMTFTQNDFNEIVGLHVLEGLNEQGHFMLGLGYPKKGNDELS